MPSERYGGANRETSQEQRYGFHHIALGVSFQAVKPIKCKIFTWTICFLAVRMCLRVTEVEPKYKNAAR